jgi:hypothetical protein
LIIGVPQSEAPTDGAASESLPDSNSGPDATGSGIQSPPTNASDSSKHPPHQGPSSQPGSQVTSDSSDSDSSSSSSSSSSSNSDSSSTSGTTVPGQDPGVQSFPGAPTDQSDGPETTASLLPSGPQPSGIFVGSMAMPKIVESTSANSESSDSSASDNEGSEPGASTFMTSPTGVASGGTYATGASVLRVRDTNHSTGSSTGSSTFGQVDSAFVYLLALGVSAIFAM